ncbi:MAG: phosphoribosyltransferase [Deltaproteobacteria bacterium]
MIFHDRQEAGKKLSLALLKYKNDKNTIILGLPRGGVVVAAEIAKALDLPLDVMVIRKIGAPMNHELAIGATDELGHMVLNEEIIDSLGVTQDYIDKEKVKEQKLAEDRLNRYRQNRPPLSLKGKTVVLIDDGLATGATMRAAIHSAKGKKAKKVIVAVPVAPPETIEKLRKEADEIVCLDIPAFFGAVGAFYEIFDQTSDEEVMKLLTHKS